MFRERTIDAHRSSTEKFRRDKHTTDLPIVPSISVCVAIDRPAARNCGTFFCLFSLLFFSGNKWAPTEGSNTVDQSHKTHI